VPLAKKMFSMNSPTPTSYKWSVDIFSLFPAISNLFANFHRLSHLLRTFTSSLMSETGSDVTSGLSDHGFLLAFNTSSRSMAHRSQIICDFSLVINGDLSFSAARGRRRPEVTSSNDRSR
jgi:hypothetical protein